MKVRGPLNQDEGVCVYSNSGNDVPRFDKADATALQSPTATLIPLFSSSELTGCGYPGLLDRKNRSDMCPRWESNHRLPACKASTLSTRQGQAQDEGPATNDLYSAKFQSPVP